MLVNVFSVLQAVPVSFWEAFFAELLASAVILAVATFVVPLYLDWRKRPLLSIRNQLNGSTVFDMTSTTDGSHEATLHMFIHNDGQTAQREYFWHLFVPINLAPQLTMLDHESTPQSEDMHINGERWRHYFSKSLPKDLVLPGRGYRFNFELKIKTAVSVREAKIFYYFVNEYGICPTRARDIESAISDSTIVPSVLFEDHLDAIFLRTVS